jgi:hypothetical protein
MPTHSGQDSELASTLTEAADDIDRGARPMTMLRQSVQTRLHELLAEVQPADLSDRELMQLVMTLEPALERITQERRPAAPVVTLAARPRPRARRIGSRGQLTGAE